MRKQARLWFFWGFCICGVTACTASKRNGDTPINPEGYCASTCQKALECDAEADTDACQSSCDAQIFNLDPSLRQDFLGYVATCVGDYDCSELTRAASSCEDEAQAVLTASASGQAFCDDYAKTATKCELDVDAVSCATAARSYTDATLTAARSCFDKPCSALGTCLADAIAGFTLPL